MLNVPCDLFITIKKWLHRIKKPVLKTLIFIILPTNKTKTKTKNERPDALAKTRGFFKINEATIGQTLTVI